MAIRKILERLLPYRAMRTTTESWDTGYASGRWDRIRDLDELAHYSVIVGYLHFFGTNSRVLDVCCGEGLLLQRIATEKLGGYLGIDISRVAIEKAESLHKYGARFIVANASEFETADEFDIIVFNECLYYFDDPLAVLERFEKSLSENGAVIVSMCKTSHTPKIWKLLSRRYRIVDSVSVSNSKRLVWEIKLLARSDYDFPVRERLRFSAPGTSPYDKPNDS